MHRLTLAPLTFGLLALPLGCQTSSGTEGSSLLCPHCTPRVGGETSDFGGGSMDCGETLGDLTRAIANEFGMDDILAAAAKPLDLPLRWSGGEQEGTSQMHARIELGVPKYYVSGVSGEEAPYCEDAIRVPAKVELQTEDGGVEASLTGVLKFGRDGFIWELQATGDLADVRGDRQLEVDTERPHGGYLRLIIRGLAEDRRGSVSPVVGYTDEELGPGEASAFESMAITPWIGTFPGDPCGELSFPVERDQPRPFLGDRSAAEVIEEALGAVTSVAWPARYRDGSNTSVALTLPQLSESNVCVARGPHVAALSFTGARIRTQDERVDLATLDYALGVEVGTGAPSSLVFSHEFPPQSPGDLAEILGFAGLTQFESELESAMGWAGAGHVDDPLFSAHVYGELSWNGGEISSFGDVRINEASTLAIVECLSWPPSGDASGCYAVQ